MSVMELKITIGPIEEREDALLGSVVIHDGAYKNLEVALDYLIDNVVQELTLHAVSFEPADEAIAGGEVYQLQPSAIRDFPMVRWDRIAKAGIRRALGGYPTNLADEQSDSGEDFLADGEVFETKGFQYVDLGAAVEESDPRRRRELAEAAVARLRPDLDPTEGKGAQRSWNSLVRYAEIFSEHEDLLARGARDPISTLAERHEVEKPTVRSWLHRAKAAGIPQVMLELDPAGAAAILEAHQERRKTVDRIDMIGQELKDVRLSQNRSREEVAEGAGVPFEMLVDIEDSLATRMRKDPVGFREVIRMIARFLGVEPAPLLERFDARKPPALTKPWRSTEGGARRAAEKMLSVEKGRATRAHQTVERARRDGRGD